MSSASLRKSIEIFDNAVHMKILRHELNSFVPLDELAKEVSKIFLLLRDAQDESARTIKYGIWRLRSTIELSLLPFDDEELLLGDQVERIQSEIRYYPDVQPFFERISKIISFLDENPVNPKREFVFRLLIETNEQGIGVGLITYLRRGGIPGWSGKLWTDIRKIAPLCRAIPSSSVLKNKIFDKIILPSGGQYSPLNHDIFYGYRTSVIDMVFYKKEPLGIKKVRKLPQGSYPVGTQKRPETPPFIEEVKQIDDWVEEDFWERIRDEAIKESFSGVPHLDRYTLVKARLVLLANKARVLLEEDHKVIEISGVLKGETDVKKFPRCKTNQLKRGDLIVLRTSGSGDYLNDIAKSLMKADGCQDLIKNAMNWKEILYGALTTFGSEFIASRLKVRGHNLRDHKYIWIWTTDHVIRPESSELFVDLISILEELECNLPENTHEKYAEEKWRQMAKVIHFRRVAGKKIRAALLEQLRRILKNGILVEDEHCLTLPGLSSGELTIFRVTDIDDRTMEVPYNKIGLIKTLDNN